jgi:glycosyltransferase involved in cell wall biosynthesis
MPEIIEESQGGFVYDNDQELVGAMDSLLENSQHRRELGLNGYSAYREKWTPEAHLKCYFELISDVAAVRGCPSVREGSNLYPLHSEFIRRPLVTD